MRIITAREQVAMTTPWRRREATGFDPGKVTNQLKGEFYDHLESLPEEHLHPDMDENNPLGHWPTIENFLKAKYPAAHRGFANGQEDAAAFMADPEHHSPMHMDDDPEGDTSHFDMNPPEPYSTDHKTIQSLGYDPHEVAAGMVLLHNKAHSGRGDAYEGIDRDRLVDIFNGRQKMQRDYEQRAV